MFKRNKEAQIFNMDTIIQKISKLEEQMTSVLDMKENLIELHNEQKSRIDNIIKELMANNHPISFKLFRRELDLFKQQTKEQYEYDLQEFHFYKDQLLRGLMQLNAEKLKLAKFVNHKQPKRKIKPEHR